MKSALAVTPLHERAMDNLRFIRETMERATAFTAVPGWGLVKFVLSLCTPILAGAVLTVVLFRSGTLAVIPGMWLLLYGAAVVAAGAFSVRIVLGFGGCTSSSAP